MAIIIVNAKTYPESSGAKAGELARMAGRVQHDLLQGKPHEVAVALSALDLVVAGHHMVPHVLWAQHCDAVKPGATTGKITAEGLKQAGAVGTLLNHAEYKLTNEVLEATIHRCHEAGLKVCACAESVARAKEMAAFLHKPDYIAVEPPELIGGNVSVSTANPQIISDTVKAVHAIADIPVLTGAGVKNQADVQKAIELGSEGILVASGVVKVADPESALQDLVKGLL